MGNWGLYVRDGWIELPVSAILLEVFERFN
ncbi:hypothetical protein BH24ACT21_BH24ACT21_00920 [soil metagenome]